LIYRAQRSVARFKDSAVCAPRAVRSCNRVGHVRRLRVPVWARPWHGC